jgi:hypothetical protein
MSIAETDTEETPAVHPTVRSVLAAITDRLPFHTESDRHEMHEQIAGLATGDPEEGDRAPTTWRPPVPVGPNGQPLPIQASTADVAALMQQNRELMAMVQELIGKPTSMPGGPVEVAPPPALTQPAEAAPAPAPEEAPPPAPVPEPAASALPTAPPVAAGDVPPGIV